MSESTLADFRCPRCGSLAAPGTYSLSGDRLRLYRERCVNQRCGYRLALLAGRCEDGQYVPLLGDDELRELVAELTDAPRRRPAPLADDRPEDYERMAPTEPPSDVPTLRVVG